MLLISDIHGWYSTLIKLLKKAPFDEIIFLGNLVNRALAPEKSFDLLLPKKL